MYFKTDLKKLPRMPHRKTKDKIHERHEVIQRTH